MYEKLSFEDATDGLIRPRGAWAKVLHMVEFATNHTLNTKQLLRRNVKRFRGGLVFEALRLLYHSTLGLRVIKKKKKKH